MQRHHFTIILTSLCLLGFNFGLHAETAKLDTIITEGRYVMGDNDSKAEAREFALMEAKRHILEQAGTFIKAHDVAKNYQLTEQQIESFSVGLIQTEILEERMAPSGETFVMTVKIRGIINPQEVQNLAEQMQQDEDASDELQQLQANYAHLIQQMDSLKQRAAQPNVPTTEIREQHRETQKLGGIPVIKSRSEGLSELNRLENLMALIAESNKKTPDMQRTARLTQQILEKHPKMVMVKGYLGIANLKNGQYRLAVKNLETAVKAENPYLGQGNLLPTEIKQRYRSTKAQFHYHLAQAYKKLGRKKMAAKNLREAQKLNPKSKRFQVERLRKRR